jgi:hypothetical protein
MLTYPGRPGRRNFFELLFRLLKNPLKSPPVRHLPFFTAR